MGFFIPVFYNLKKIFPQNVSPGRELRLLFFFNLCFSSADKQKPTLPPQRKKRRSRKKLQLVTKAEKYTVLSLFKRAQPLIRAPPMVWRRPKLTFNLNYQNCPKILNNCLIFNPKSPLESSEPQIIYIRETIRQLYPCTGHPAPLLIHSGK